MLLIEETERLWALYKSQYQVLFEYHPGKGRNFIGDKNRKWCRICGRSAPEVTFRKKAHAVPELIGNKTVITYEECDDCNSGTSSIEDHFAKYLGLHRTVGQIHGKGGVPNYKARKSRIGIDSSGFNIIDYVDDSIVEHDFANQRLTIRGPRQTYIPWLVYKCLCKICITLVPEKELPELRYTLAWIRSFQNLEQEEYHTEQALVWIAFTPGPMPYPPFFCLIFQRRKDAILQHAPYMVMSLGFGNFFFTVPIPFIPASDLLNGSLNIREVFFPPYPSPIPVNGRYGPTTYRQADLASRLPCKNEPHEIHLRYKAIEHLPLTEI